MLTFPKQLPWVAVLHLPSHLIFTQHHVVAITILFLHVKQLRHGVVKRLGRPQIASDCCADVGAQWPDCTSQRRGEVACYREADSGLQTPAPSTPLVPAFSLTLPLHQGCLTIVLSAISLLLAILSFSILPNFP